MGLIQEHPGQWNIWNSPARNKIVVAGRRWGKTVLGCEWLLNGLNKARSRNVYTAPTRQDAKDIAWEYLKGRIAQLKWSVKINESELSIYRLKNKSKLSLKTAEKESSHRGRAADRYVLDEYAEYKSAKLWHTAIRPTMSDRQGEALFLLTPKGLNHAYELYQEAQTKKGWAAFKVFTKDAPHFSTPEGIEELENAKRDLSEKDYRQEYEASFETYSGRIYYSFDRASAHIDYDYNPNNPDIIVGMDFNRSPMSASLFQRANGIFIQFSEISLRVSNTEEICSVIKQKYPKANIIVRPDATGIRKTSNSSISDFDIIKKHGYTIQSGNLNPRRVDRWAAVNRAYEKGLVKINVNKCPVTVKDREILCYKEGTCEPMLNDPFLGHMSDSCDYAIYREYPLTTDKIKIGTWL